MPVQATTDVTTQVEALADRLSSIGTINFPASLRIDSGVEPSLTCKKEHLTSLLQRDIAVFLEKYGKFLEPSELSIFDSFADDYEISWYLNKLRVTLAQNENLSLVKNRRLAHMCRLIDFSDYFSLDVMKWRDPLLYFEQIGQFESSSTARFARPGERYSDTLIRQTEEMAFRKRVSEEQKRAEGANCEEEEESDDEGESATSRETETAIVNPAIDTGFVEIPPEEMDERKEYFMRVMKERFLAGLDRQFVDYKWIDGDATLDDDWLEEISRDAEDKYFSED